MIRNLLQLTYQDHHVHVARDSKNNAIILFKYNKLRCDFAIFGAREWEEAAEYVLTPLPEGEWAFVPDADSE